MTFNPCVVIPIYNHGDRIARVVNQLSAYELPIYIMDDGSDAATCAALQRLQQQSPCVRLHRLPYNQGKGAAVMQGLRMAYADGHTHAIQIDADGQHAPQDVPRFLSLARQHPSAVVCGKPIYDHTIPKGRLYGRYITHFWVWIETLSFQIGDSMCGFRLYPLAPTCALIEKESIAKRMDFDTEIVVKLAWMGLPIHNVPTRVTYPADGLSHFKMWADNVRITKMHTRLCFGMLRRLPQLLWRKWLRHPSPHWAQLSERGSTWGMQCLMLLQKCLGPRITALALHPVVAYFFLVAGSARSASRQFLTQAATLQQQPPPRWIDSYRHMYAFAHSALDKLAAWQGGSAQDRINFNNPDVWAELKQQNKGALLIGSHLGNLEMMRALASHEHHITVNAVVYTDHAMRFNHLMAQTNAHFTLNLIQVRTMGPDTAIVLKEKIDRGEWLVIVGDRTPPAETGRTTPVSFMGQPAHFAQGPMLLAHLLECPVYLFFCVHHHQRYEVHLEKFADAIQLPRTQRQHHLQQWLQLYANRLEAYALKHPLQWFNFFDFWRLPERSTATL